MGEKHTPVIGPRIKPPFVFAELPQITCKKVSKARTEPAERAFSSIRCATARSDNHIPGVIGIEPDELRSPRSHLICSVEATPLYATADVQCPIEGTHAEDSLVEDTAMSTKADYFCPTIGWVARRCGFPDLESPDSVQCAGVEMVIEDSHRKN
jgi:hypothetical protein